MAAVKHRLIKDFFNVHELMLLQKYCYNKLDANNDYVIDTQSFSPAWYKDSLMTALLDLKLPRVEEECNLELFPTYAYWRYYIFGATLKNHLDRPACEISVTACIKKYDNWPLIVGTEEIELEEGDAVIYPGCDQTHGRPGMYKGEGMAQVFLHYVDQYGPYKDHAYDQIGKTNE